MERFSLKNKLQKLRNPHREREKLFCFVKRGKKYYENGREGKRGK